MEAKVFAVMPIVVNVDGNPVFTSHIISLALLAIEQEHF